MSESEAATQHSPLCRVHPERDQESKMNEQLTNDELCLLIEALTKAASRHTSEAKFYPARKRIHNKKAEAMRSLASRLTTRRVNP